MKLQNSVVAITGAANGIGYALAKRFKAEGARGIAVADIDAAKIAAVAKEIGALGFACDVSREQDIQRVVRDTETAFGPIYFAPMLELAWPIPIATTQPPRPMPISRDPGTSTSWRMSMQPGRCCRR